MEKSKIRVGAEAFDLADARVREFVGYNGLEYELSANGNYYIVTGRGGERGSEIIIPDTYQGKPVLEVADNAFKDDAEITKFVVGRYVIFIGVGNIETLPNLTELYFTAESDYDFINTIEMVTGQCHDLLHGIGKSETMGYYIDDAEVGGDGYCICPICIYRELVDGEITVVPEFKGNSIERFKNMWGEYQQNVVTKDFVGIHMGAFAN